MDSVDELHNHQSSHDKQGAHPPCPQHDYCCYFRKRKNDGRRALPHHPKAATYTLTRSEPAKIIDAERQG